MEASQVYPLPQRNVWECTKSTDPVLRRRCGLTELGMRGDWMAGWHGSTPRPSATAALRLLVRWYTRKLFSFFLMTVKWVGSPELQIFKWPCSSYFRRFTWESVDCYFLDLAFNLYQQELNTSIKDWHCNFHHTLRKRLSFSFLSFWALLKH